MLQKELTPEKFDLKQEEQKPVTWYDMSFGIPP
jgi:hypothetical protein